MTPNKQNVWNIRDPKFESDRINPWLKTSPWSGHRSFAYDLLAFVQPARVLELGTHYGASFFAFCQSAKDLGLTTKIVGIDSWEGDIHAGFYGEEVWESVQAIKSTCFTNIDALCIRKLFNDALPDVEDNSVDILHIDGLHTYEAVSHDYKSWLPKLADDGIVLFHDVGKETGYGSHEFWKEISKDLPHYTFEHSWGLGVLFPKGARWYDQMEASNMQDKLFIYQYKAQYELAHQGNIDKEALIIEKSEGITAMEKMIQERDEITEGQKKLIEERLGAMKEMEAMIQARDTMVESQKALIEDRLRSIEEMETMIQERDNTITQLNIIQAENIKKIEQYASYLAVLEKNKVFRALRSLHIFS